jgi:hypothetical protein
VYVGCVCSCVGYECGVCVYEYDCDYECGVNCHEVAWSVTCGVAWCGVMC